MTMIEGVGLFIGSISFFLIGRYTRKTLDNKEEPINKVEKYLHRGMSLFQLLFDANNDHFVNSNINFDLFCFETFEKMTEDMEEECKWKRRILLEPTPYGNIVMYYDFYRQAFAYFSDTHISYSILNTCAMKYVRMFSCRDFFVDTSIIPSSFVNPLNRVKEEAEKREKEKTKQKKKELNLNFDSSVFVKPLATETGGIVGILTPLVYKNNFRCMGRIANWDMLSKSSPIINETASIKSPDNNTGYANWKRNKTCSLK